MRDNRLGRRLVRWAVAVALCVGAFAVGVGTAAATTTSDGVSPATPSPSVAKVVIVKQVEATTSAPDGTASPDEAEWN